MAEGGEPLSRLTMSMPQSFMSIKSDQLAFLKYLGRGGFGQVSLQRHENWGKVAVKQVIYKKITQDMRDSFYKEAKKMLDVIASPYIVSVMGMLDTADGGISIVMEYLEFGNLKNFTALYLVTKDPAANPGDNDVYRNDCWPRRIRMICDMIMGMNYLHTLVEPVFHRDLKLENVFVGSGFRVKIGDLGLAVSRVSRSVACQTGEKGTTTHIPPEILTGKALKATEAWDRYSFGITLFEFVTLTFENGSDIPYPAYAHDGLLHVWATNNVKPNDELILPDTPDVVKTTIKECWDTDPKKRPSFQVLKNRFIPLYEERYESTITAADTQILFQIHIHKTEESNRAPEPPTGLTPSTGPIHPMHDGTVGSSNRNRTKQPVQNASSAGRSSADSNQSGSQTPGSTSNPGVAHTQPRMEDAQQPAHASNSSPGRNGLGGELTSEPSADDTITPLTSLDSKPTNSAPPLEPFQGRLPHGQPMSSTEAIVAEISAQPSSTLQHQTAAASQARHQVTPGTTSEGVNHSVQPSSSTFSTNTRPSEAGAASMPGQTPANQANAQQETTSPNHIPPISPLKSMVHASKTSAQHNQHWQQQQNQQERQEERHEDGTTRFSTSSSKPLQPTGLDDNDTCLVVDLPKGDQSKGDFHNQVEELRRPFQGMNLQDNPQGATYRHHMADTRRLPGRTGVSDRHLQILTAKLGPDDLKHLYHALGIKHIDVQKAEASTNSHDLDIKAWSVLRRWRKQKGSGATCEAILTALVMCNNIQAKEELLDDWNLRDVADQGSDQSTSYINLGGEIHRVDQRTVTAVPMQERYQGSTATSRVLVTSASTDNLFYEPNQSSHPPKRNLTIPQRNPRSRSLSPNLTKRPSPPTTDRPITDKDIERIEKHIGTKYRQLGRALGLSDVEISTVHHDHHLYGTVEVVHQVLMKWKNKNGSKAKKSVLIGALRKAELAPLCDKIR
ncbi:uncharacterized protein [Amphiura filiformis]|uniref:uncharacterized protein n=1 Tax=Amphiura filiformis TaxID=82378 RepID=UPI003B21432F